MAALTSSGVTIVTSWTEGDVTGKRYTVMQVKIVLSTNGSETNPIPATAFGLETIIDASPFVLSDNSNVRIACPDYTGANLLITSTGSPTDVSGTYQGIVKGILNKS